MQRAWKERETWVQQTEARVTNMPWTNLEWPESLIRTGYFGGVKGEESIEVEAMANYYNEWRPAKGPSNACGGCAPSQAIR